MSLARLRTFFLPAFIASLAVLIATFGLESGLGLLPCSLCYSQRVLLGLYCFVCLCALLHAPGLSGWRRYAWATLLCSTGGALLAARHVWLQGSGLAAQSCREPLSVVFEQSWGHVVKMLLLGGPDCDSLAWSFLDLTLPEWSLLAFLLLAALPLYRLLAYRFRGFDSI